MEWIVGLHNLAILILLAGAQAQTKLHRAPKNVRVPPDTVTSTGFWVDWSRMKMADSYKVVVAYSHPRHGKGIVHDEEDIFHFFTVVDGLLPGVDYTITVTATVDGMEGVPAVLTQRTVGDRSEGDILTKGCTLNSNDYYVPGEIIVNRTKEIRLVVPNEWDPDKFYCHWDIKLSKKHSIMMISFVTRHSKALTEEDGICLAEVTVSLGERYFMPFKFCSGSLDSELPVYTSPTSAKITMILDAAVLSKMQGTEFDISFSVDEDVPSNLPKVASVKTIQERKGRLIKNHSFTWEEARRYCKRKYRGWDLCKKDDKTLCDDGKWMFHYPFDENFHFFPVLEYNAWMNIDQRTETCALYPGPPPWGYDTNLCPKGGCEVKSHILCCPSGGDLKTYTFKTKQIYITSARLSNGQNIYRLSSMADTDFPPSLAPIIRRFWKVSGRLEGDVTQFQIYETYSPKSETPVFFCRKQVKPVGGEDKVDNVRYMASLSPCELPWEYVQHYYATLKHKKRLRPIHFGRSTAGEGTRVSLTPPCCGFDDPDGSFIIYGHVKKSWVAELSSRFCTGQRWFTGQLPGRISSSTNLKENYFPSLFCHWRIIVRRHYGVLISYNTINFLVNDCNRNYLEFLNPVSQRVLGRVCGSKNGTFSSDGNVVEVKFVVEDSDDTVNLPSFSLTYEKTWGKSPVPVALKMATALHSWADAKNLCEEQELRMCSVKDLCPVGNYPIGGITDEEFWVPVSDGTNQWISAGGQNDAEACRLYDGVMEPKLDHNIVYCCN